MSEPTPMTLRRRLLCWWGLHEWTFSHVFLQTRVDGLTGSPPMERVATYRCRHCQEFRYERTK
jgi:hypothetical protein